MRSYSKRHNIDSEDMDRDEMEDITRMRERHEHHMHDYHSRSHDEGHRDIHQRHKDLLTHRRGVGYL